MKPDFFQFNNYLTEALHRVETVLRNSKEEKIEIDDCIVDRLQLEKLQRACRQALRGEAAEIKIPLELIVMEEFWRNFSNFLKEK